MHEGNEQVTATAWEVLSEEEEALKLAAHDLDGLLRANPSLVSWLAVSRAWQLAQDVWVASENFRLAHAEATARHQAKEAEDGNRFLLQFGGSLTATTSSDRFRAAFKALLFAVRAYQDGMYVLLLSLSGQRATGGSMATAGKKPENQVAELVTPTIPEYFEWFSRWKTLRDRVKTGASFGVVGPTHDLGISVNDFMEGGGLQVSFHEDSIFRIGDAIAAVHVSQRLAQLARVTTDRRLAGIE